VPEENIDYTYAYLYSHRDNSVEFVLLVTWRPRGSLDCWVMLGTYRGQQPAKQ